MKRQRVTLEIDLLPLAQMALTVWILEERRESLTHLRAELKMDVALSPR